MAKNFRNFVAIAITVFLTLGAVSPANASSVPKLFFIAIQGDGLGLYSVSLSADKHSTVGQPVAITADTAAAHTSRELATDGQYLYFVDNSHGLGLWDLVRTDLLGNNRTLLVPDVGSVSKIVVTGVSIYYSVWDKGVYRASAVGQTVPTLVFGYDNPAGYPMPPSSGWGPFIIKGGKLYVDNYSTGIFEMDLSFAGASNVNYISDNNYPGWMVTSLDFDAVTNNYYAWGWNSGTLWGTTDLSLPTNGNWTQINPSGLQCMCSPGFFRTFYQDGVVYSTDSYGHIWATDLAHGNQAYSLLGIDENGAKKFTDEDYGIAIANADGLANTGSDYSGLYTSGIALLISGLVLVVLRKRVSAN